MVNIPISVFAINYSFKRTFTSIADTTLKKNISKADTLKKSDNGKLKSKIKYTAKDSIRFDIEAKKVYLFGKAEVTYEDINLKAASIMIDWNDQTVTAKEGKDSLGKIIGKPEFTQGGQKFTSTSMKYNFETKKGKINQITTSEGDGFIRGETIKKDAENNFYIRNGYYTTCSADTPHFYIGSRKLKVIKDDKIVTGPAFLVIEGITTPLFLPFGFFPHKSGRSSGILIPAYGEDNTRGFNLRNGGYYFGISDNLDFTLRGDIYTQGSWALNGATSYVKRYGYNGNFKLSYSNMLNGDRDLPNFSINRNFMIDWSHRKDPKSNPLNQFSASVHAGSSSFYQNNVTYNANNLLTNTFHSSISYSRLFPNKPYNFSINADHNQDLRTKTVTVTLPNIAFSVTRINPFKSKTKVGPEKWYENIGLNYTAVASNQVQTSDSLFFKEQTLKKMRNGMKQSSSMSTSFKILKYFSLSPSISYNEYWYLQTIRKRSATAIDTVYGFKSARDFSFGTSTSTTIYGMLQFKNPVIKAIRHVITPSIGYSWRPDFGDSKYGFYGEYKTPEGKTQKYSYFEQGIYSGPGMGKSSNVNLSIDNNLELKVRDRNDTVSGTKKIKIFESLKIGTTYNLAVDSFNLSNIGISGRTTLIKDLGLNFNGTINPYAADANGVNKNMYELNKSGRIGRLTNANLSTGYSFKSGKKNTTKPDPQANVNVNEQELAMIKAHPEEYIDFNIPWSFNVSYNINYAKLFNNATSKAQEFTQALSFSGDLSLTSNWKISFTSGYDFLHKDVTYTNLTIHRDLHCWEMKLYWIPFGTYQSYNFQINVKSSVLQDLKLLRRRDWNAVN